MNLPGDHPSARSTATPKRAKSAILGLRTSLAFGSWVRDAARAPSKAPRIFGFADSNSDQNSASSRRFSASRLGSKTTIDRSRRSPRVASSAIPFRTIGRCTLMIVSLRSVYSWRVASPPPVARRQRASESQPGKWLRLSNVMTHELLAAMKRSRSSRGPERRGAALGSTRFLSTALVELLQLPCSPFKVKIGNGPRRRKAARIQVNTSGHSSSETLRNDRSWLTSPPTTGFGSGLIPRERTNFTGGFAINLHPLVEISTAF